MLRSNQYYSLRHRGKSRDTRYRYFTKIASHYGNEIVTPIMITAVTAEDENPQPKKIMIINILVLKTLTIVWHKIRTRSIIHHLTRYNFNK